MLIGLLCFCIAKLLCNINIKFSHQMYELSMTHQFQLTFCYLQLKNCLYKSVFSHYLYFFRNKNISVCLYLSEKRLFDLQLTNYRPMLSNIQLLFHVVIALNKCSNTGSFVKEMHQCTFAPSQVDTINYFAACFL